MVVVSEFLGACVMDASKNVMGVGGAGDGAGADADAGPLR